MIFGKIVCEIVLFIKDILCKIMNELIIFEMSLIIIDVKRVFCKNW